jgi:hypothetical protein
MPAECSAGLQAGCRAGVHALICQQTITQSGDQRTGSNHHSASASGRSRSLRNVGTAANKLRVYACCGAVRRRLAEPVSTTSPPASPPRTTVAADPLPARSRALPSDLSCDACDGRQQSQDGESGRAFPRSRFAYQSHHFAFFEAEAHATHGFYRTKAHPQIAYLKKSATRPSPQAHRRPLRPG